METKSQCSCVCKHSHQNRTDLVSFTEICSQTQIQFLNFLLHFCGMKQNLFGNLSFLFLCVMPLFLESVCLFHPADESRRVDGRWEAEDPLRWGAVCSCKCVCRCVCILGQRSEGHYRRGSPSLCGGTSHSLRVDSLTLGGESE